MASKKKVTKTVKKTVSKPKKRVVKTSIPKNENIHLELPTAHSEHGSSSHTIHEPAPAPSVSQTYESPIPKSDTKKQLAGLAWLVSILLLAVVVFALVFL